MTIDNSSFQSISREVAKRFIQTVVMVDDQAFRSHAEDQPDSVREPPAPMAVDESVEQQPIVVDSQKSTDSGRMEGGEAFNSPRMDENLEAKKLIHLFARSGLVCSVIEPDKTGEPSASEAVQVARRADVLVLDWQICKDDGQTAKQILRSVLQEDKSRGGRLRLVAIYTGSLNFSVIEKGLMEVMVEVGLSVKTDEQQIALMSNHVRIVVLAKQDSRELRHFKVDYVATDALPDRLVTEFAQLTAGLIANVALEGFSVLRDATHAVLANLHNGLDPAYVTHRALQVQPDDAIDHAIDIVASEVTALLHGFEVGNVSNFRAVAAWLKLRNLNSLSLKRSLACKSEDIERLLKEGYEKWRKTGVGTQAGNAKTATRQLTHTFAKSSDAGDVADKDFAIVTSTTRRYGENQPPPRLTLGTVLREYDLASGNFRYWICLQPRCDSVRIPQDGRAFVLVPAEKSKDGRFDFVLNVDGEYVSLVVGEKIYELRSVLFAPKIGMDVVRATAMCDRYVFEQSNVSREFVWVAQFKEAHAQRLLNRFAAKLARVGLNESEWLRMGSDRTE